MSHSPRFGFRFESYSSNDSFYDTTDNQPMTAHIAATVRGNSFSDNGEYGVLVEGAFATRANPRKFTAVFSGSFEDNDFTGNGRAGIFVGFMLNGVVTRNPGLINSNKYPQDSRFEVEVNNEDGESVDFDYDNPAIDPFDKITPLNSVLTVNGVTFTGKRITCPPGFPCVP